MQYFDGYISIDNSIDIIEIFYRIKMKILYCNKDLFLFYVLL